LASLLSGELRSLRSRFGENHVRLDLFEKTLEISGGEDEGFDLKVSYSLQLQVHEYNWPQKKFLATAIAKLRIQYSSECSRSYCKACFILYISLALVNRAFPICCITCNTKLDLKILSRVSKLITCFRLPFFLSFQSIRRLSHIVQRQMSSNLSTWPCWFDFSMF